MTDQNMKRSLESDRDYIKQILPHAIAHEACNMSALMQNIDRSFDPEATAETRLRTLVSTAKYYHALTPCIYLHAEQQIIAQILSHTFASTASEILKREGAGEERNKNMMFVVKQADEAANLSFHDTPISTRASKLWAETIQNLLKCSQRALAVEAASEALTEDFPNVSHRKTVLGIAQDIVTPVRHNRSATFAAKGNKTKQMG